MKINLKNKLRKTIALSGAIVAFSIAAPSFAQYDNGPGPGYDSSPGYDDSINSGPGYDGPGYYGGPGQAGMGRVRQWPRLARRTMVASPQHHVVLPQSSGMGRDGRAVAQPGRRLRQR